MLAAPVLQERSSCRRRRNLKTGAPQPAWLISTRLGRSSSVRRRAARALERCCAGLDNRSSAERRSLAGRYLSESSLHKLYEPSDEPPALPAQPTPAKITS